MSVSVFRKGPAKEAHCALLPHRENQAIGCGAPVIVVYGRATREKPLAIWPLVFRRPLPWCVGSIELNKRIYILPLYLCASVPQARLCLTLHGAPCHAAQMKARHSAGWAHSSSALGPQLCRLPSLPLFRKRGALTLSAAAGTFENNCLYDCYFSYLFEEV